MSETDYNALLYEKMKAEQDKYRDWLLTQEPAEILNQTYEYTMCEDIVMAMEDLELTPKQAKALLKESLIKSRLRLGTHLACIFSLILHINFLTYASMPAKFLCNLTKNLTVQSAHQILSVLP